MSALICEICKQVFKDPNQFKAMDLFEEHVLETGHGLNGGLEMTYAIEFDGLIVSGGFDSEEAAWNWLGNLRERAQVIEEVK